MGIKAGWALDLTQVDPDDGQLWDFSKTEKQAKVKKMVEAD